MTVDEAKAEFNRILGNLGNLRHQYTVYGDDWATLPAAVKTVVRARVSSVIAQASTDLGVLNTAIQGQ